MSRMSLVPWVFAAGMLLAAGTTVSVPAPAVEAVQPVLEAEHDSHDDAGHTDHEVPADTGHDATSHEAEPDSVASTTKRSVLAGFAAVNASVIIGAFLIRRRDRGAGRSTRRTAGGTRARRQTGKTR